MIADANGQILIDGVGVIAIDVMQLQADTCSLADASTCSHSERRSDRVAICRVCADMSYKKMLGARDGARQAALRKGNANEP